MTLDDFKKAKIVAMKAHNQNAVSALNVVINKLMLLSIEKRTKNEALNTSDSIAALQKAEKELIEEREGFEKAGRVNNVESLNKQIDVIKQYLPKLLSNEEIANIIMKLEDKSVPNVMRHFKSEYQGKCDMKTVSQVLNDIFK